MTRKTKELTRKIVTVSPCPPQIPHGLPLEQTKASAVESQPLPEPWPGQLSTQTTNSVTACTCTKCQSFHLTA